MSRRWLLGALLISGISHANNFSIDQMPIGAEVTVPPTAKTVVPMGTRVKLTSTDNPQTIRIVPVGNGSVFPAAIKLAIFDAHQDRVKYVEVAPNAPFLYSFKGLSSISIQSALVKGGADTAKGVRMEIESDKAVTVAR
jgi:hypothetical protein